MTVFRDTTRTWNKWPQGRVASSSQILPPIYEVRGCHSSNLPPCHMLCDLWPRGTTSPSSSCFLDTKGLVTACQACTRIRRYGVCKSRAGGTHGWTPFLLPPEGRRQSLPTHPVSNSDSPKADWNHLSIRRVTSLHVPIALFSYALASFHPMWCSECSL